MTGKFELVAQIEDRIGTPTAGLWKADKATLEAILKHLPVPEATVIEQRNADGRHPIG